MVVAGGKDSPSLSHIYHVADGVWRDGPPMPQPLTLGTVVQMQDFFQILGGYNGTDYTDMIIEFDPLSMSWIEKEQKLSHGKHLFFATGVDKSKFCS